MEKKTPPFKHVFLIFLLAIQNIVFSQPTDRLYQITERIFKTEGRAKLKVYIFQPSQRTETEKLPAIAFFHGGAWVGGHAWQFKPQCGYLAERGIVALTFEYRVRKKFGATPFESVADVKSAIRWIRENADELGIDIHRIVASGGSSGGHLAACTATIQDADEENEEEGINSAPDALVLFNPVLDVPEVIPQLPKKTRNILKGHEKEISPIHHVVEGLPPTIIFHGTADSSVPFHQATSFCEKMKQSGNLCELIPFEGREHGFFNYFKGENPDFFLTMKETVRFLESIGIIKDGQESQP